MRTVRVSLCLFIAVVVLLGLHPGTASLQAARPSPINEKSSATKDTERGKVPKLKQGRITNEQRKAAAVRLAKMRMKVAQLATGSTRPAVMTMPHMHPMPGGTPDYFGCANWAYSPSLRKFVDSLPGLGAANANALGQYIPVAIPDTTTYPDADYYEIELGEYTEKMHSDLAPTTLRGYRQTNTTDTTVSQFHYLGPMIVARKDRPVRIKFTNKLPIGDAGNLFIPVDTTVMGAGMGHLGMDIPSGTSMNYTQNRATIHLHGGRSPWISDGTPHQWITPAGENTAYKKGVSAQNVPDMPDPGEGSLTFYYTNQQSARLMFYHDHSFGITRLNVYAGEAAGYQIIDPVEQELIDCGCLPQDQIPLIIQDKSFVDAATVRVTDPTWNWGTGTLDPLTGVREPKSGDLWYPHVYVPAQNPGDLSGVNPYGRWHYGPWFWPPTTNIAHGPVDNPYYDPLNAPWEPPLAPGVPDVSMPGESYMDTAVVNGTAFPTLEVEPKAYRFRVLNAANDRFFNLQLFEADPTIVADDGRTNTEVRMIPAVRNTAYPDWPADGREGGVPDPTTAGPSWIQIGTEGGFLPAPVVVPNQPVTWNTDPTTFNFGNVDMHSLLLAPAERADVIVDFSQYAGKTLILYNDAPAAFPALDQRYDYYAGNPDLTDVGGHSGTKAGYGPNTRTIMQIKVKATTPATAYDVEGLKAEFASTATAQGVFARSQEPILIPNSEYNTAYNTTFPADTFVRIHDTAKKFNTVTGTTVTFPLQPKAIQDEMGEAFDLEYGRMSGKLGLQLPITMTGRMNFVLQNFTDPPTEKLTGAMTPVSPVEGDGTQLWKITHNGVDTHPIHFHLFDVQLINRVGWDGAIRPPDLNELGWKDTVRVSPLEDTIVALRPIIPKQPFGIPDSVRPLDPTMPIGSTMGFTNVDPSTGEPLATPTTNKLINFGWEYMWHCHILSHEEMDMMRPIVFNVDCTVPDAPVLNITQVGTKMNLTWTDGTPVDSLATLGNLANEIGFRVERADVGTNGVPGAYMVIGAALANATSYCDIPTITNARYSYRVVAFNAAGEKMSNAVLVGPQVTPPAAPTNLVGSLLAGPQVRLTWRDNATNETGFVLERSVNGGNFEQLVTLGSRYLTGSTTYTDTTPTYGNTYLYRVKAMRGTVSSAYSNSDGGYIPLPSPPTAPTNLTSILQSGPQVRLTWRDNATSETGFVIECSVNNGVFTQVAAPGPRTSTGSVTYTSTAVAPGNTYKYRVKAMNGPSSSAYTNTVTVVVPVAPAAPTGLTATAARLDIISDRVTLRWTDKAGNETGFEIQRATNATFTTGLYTYTVTANTIVFRQTVTRRATYYYRIRAVNLGGTSAWVNATPFPITTP